MLVKKYLPGIMTHGRDHVPEHLTNCGFDFLSIIEQVFLTQIWVSSNAGLDIYLVNWRQVGWPERPHSEQPEKETLWNEISTADNCLAKINNIRPMSSSGPSPVFLLWLASPRQKSQYLVVSTLICFEQRCKLWTGKILQKNLTRYQGWYINAPQQKVQCKVVRKTSIHMSTYLRSPTRLWMPT